MQSVYGILNQHGVFTHSEFSDIPAVFSVHAIAQLGLQSNNAHCQLAVRLVRRQLAGKPFSRNLDLQQIAGQLREFAAFAFLQRNVSKQGLADHAVNQKTQSVGQ